MNNGVIISDYSNGLIRKDKRMEQMTMALEMFSAIEELSLDDFVVEYNRITGNNITGDKVAWNGFPVYYDPE